MQPAVAARSRGVAAPKSGDYDRHKGQAGGSDPNGPEDPHPFLSRPLDPLGAPKHTPHVVERRLHIGEPCLSVRDGLRIRNPHVERTLANALARSNS
jgi:hypothetical protein